MSHDITLYGFGGTRSARCRWTLLELDLPFEYVDDSKLIGTDRLREMQPLAKLPAALFDGQPVFESAAICTYACDLAPEKGLLASSGTRERALHLQWVSFAQSEMEAWLWSAAKHKSFYPEARRVPAVIESNQEEFRSGAEAMNAALADTPYLVDGKFSVTDIIVSWTVNWGRRMGLIDDLANLRGYLDRLFERPHCTLNSD